MEFREFYRVKFLRSKMWNFSHIHLTFPFWESTEAVFRGNDYTLIKSIVVGSRCISLMEITNGSPQSGLSKLFSIIPVCT